MTEKDVNLPPPYRLAWHDGTNWHELGTEGGWALEVVLRTAELQLGRGDVWVRESAERAVWMLRRMLPTAMVSEEV